jgi:hypothetical protein
MEASGVPGGSAPWCSATAQRCFEDEGLRPAAHPHQRPLSCSAAPKSSRPRKGGWSLVYIAFLNALSHMVSFVCWLGGIFGNGNSRSLTSAMTLLA